MGKKVVENSMIFGGKIRALAGAAPTNVVNRHTKADEILDNDSVTTREADSQLDCESNPRGDLNAYPSPLNDGKTTICGPCEKSNIGDCDACNATWCGLEGSTTLLMDLPDVRDRRIKGTLLVPHSI